MTERDSVVAQEYEAQLNNFFVERGIGWEMREADIVTRGSEVFSTMTGEAAHVLADHGRSTAAREMHEALRDLSRRPDPDVSGAIQHAMAAIECVARDVAVQPNLTLGEVLNRHSDLLGIRPHRLMREAPIVTRGSEVFSTMTGEAAHVLADHGRSTAAREMHEALRDLSRRPDPDVSGAIQHAMAAIECVARDVAVQPNLTLGEVLNRHSDLLGIRPPLDQALHKLWGYTSQEGRHLNEGQNPRFEEAELVVGLSSAVCLYLTKTAN